MDELCQLICKDLFRRIQLRAFPPIHLINFLDRKEGQHTNAFQYVRISYVPPILIEFKRGRLIRVEPHRAALGLSHLLPFRIKKQRNRHGACILAKLPSDQLCAPQHVAPLVVPAKLHITAVFLEQHIEIIALHDHIVELKEAKPLLHPLLITFGRQHAVH